MAISFEDAVKILTEAGVNVESENLSDLMTSHVYDKSDNEANNIIDGGCSTQLKYLMKDTSDEEIKELLNELIEEYKDYYGEEDKDGETPMEENTNPSPFSTLRPA